MEVAEVRPNLSTSSIVRYLLRRIPTLKPPPFEERKHLLNPLSALRLITLKQWNFIGVAFFGWAWDGFDFYAVSVTVPQLAEALNKEVTDITWGITLVLMLRSVGAAIFGLAGDKWGRKWPFIINCLLFIILEIGLGFVKTFKQFLAIRALFGIAMGGMFGNAAATALEDCPVEARGFISGLFQQGYAVGCLLVVIFNRALVPTTKESWRSLYWFSAGPPVLFIIWRLMLPETDYYLKRKHEQRDNLGKTFFKQSKEAIKTHWLILIFLVLFMTGMCFIAHGSQDLFPTRLTNQLGYSSNASTVSNCVANLGAIFGGIVFGHISQFVGRRLTLMICFVVAGALIYPWGFATSEAGINASVFFFQALLQGAGGVVPIYISELSPEALRSFVVGTTYQLGNLAAAAASTIEARIGEKFPLTNAEGAKIYNYGKVMAIIMGAVLAYTFLVILLGPERHISTGPSHEDISDFVGEEEKYDKVEYNENTSSDHRIEVV